MPPMTAPPMVPRPTRVFGIVIKSIICMILFIFQNTPKTLDKEVIHPAAFTIHTNHILIFLQLADRILSGKLTPLIGVEDLRLTPCERHGIAQGSHTKPTVYDVT